MLFEFDNNRPFSLKEQSLMIRCLYQLITGWNSGKYFKRRQSVITGKGNVLVRMYYLLWIKRKDCRKGCSFGTLWKRGAQFASLPNLPHGPNGIIVGYDAAIGKNCTIYHQVTISWGGKNR